MRRIVMLLTVVALLVGMLAMSVAPAFALTLDARGCRLADNLYTQDIYSPGSYRDHNGDGWVCSYYNFNNDKWRDADNHLLR